MGSKQSKASRGANKSDNVPAVSISKNAFIQADKGVNKSSTPPKKQNSKKMLWLKQNHRLLKHLTDVILIKIYKKIKKYKNRECKNKKIQQQKRDREQKENQEKEKERLQNERKQRAKADYELKQKEKQESDQKARQAKLEATKAKESEENARKEKLEIDERKQREKRDADERVKKERQQTEEKVRKEKREAQERQERQENEKREAKERQEQQNKKEQERQERQEHEKREAKERQERQEREKREAKERQEQQERQEREKREAKERQEQQEREKREQERKAAALVERSNPPAPIKTRPPMEPTEIQEMPSTVASRSKPPEPKKQKKEPKKEKKSKPPKDIAKSYSQTELPRSPKSIPMHDDDDGIPPEPISDPGYDNKGAGKGNTWEQKMAEKAVGEKMEERNKIRGRRGNAANFMDNQIKSIIDRLKKNGGSMSYGKLFTETQDQMDALSAVLHTAKKRGNVEYDGVMLMQGQDDDVIIKLLKEKVEETKVFQSAMYDPKEIAEVLQTPTGPENCYICSKTVYPAERIAPNSKVMHKNCFRCHECNNLLRIDAYCLNNGKFYCKPDYERLVKSAGGSYQF